jgi:hypothetical protein
LLDHLVAALLKRDPSSFEPSEVKELLATHESVTGISLEMSSLSSDSKKVQHLLSTERHEASFNQLKTKLGVRSQNLMVACSMPHASDWLLAPPIAGLGLGLQSDVFRTALKFRLGMHLFHKPFPCPMLSIAEVVCDDQMNGHALCCHNSPSLLFRHNNIRDILGHSARAAGLAAVVIEKKDQIDGSNARPGDITLQQYHRGFATSAFDVTISHPLQKKFIEIAMEAGVVAQEAHDRKLLKSLAVCEKEGIHFVPLAWESTGGN